LGGRHTAAATPERRPQRRVTASPVSTASGRAAAEPRYLCLVCHGLRLRQIRLRKCGFSKHASAVSPWPVATSDQPSEFEGGMGPQEVTTDELRDGDRQDLDSIPVPLDCCERDALRLAGVRGPPPM
jgi:hypothetical protein